VNTESVHCELCCQLKHMVNTDTLLK